MQTESKFMQTNVFDVETGPLAESELSALLPPFDPAEVKTGNLKDPAKIAEKIAEAEANHRCDFIERAALVGKQEIVKAEIRNPNGFMFGGQRLSMRKNCLKYFLVQLVEKFAPEFQSEGACQKRLPDLFFLEIR